MRIRLVPGTREFERLHSSSIVRVRKTLFENLLQAFFMDHTATPSVSQLETFPNPRPGREYEVEIVCPEFTSVCPVTGQPDFGTITITYTPAAICVELKSFKLYLQGFRSQGIFYEAVTNRLLDDFVAACNPVRCKVVSRWTPRGGISTNVTCVYEAGQ